MNGFNGKIARIDLTNAEVSIENPSETFYRQYLGGRGFIIHHLLNELPAGIAAADQKAGQFLNANSIPISATQSLESVTKKTFR